MKNLKKYFKGFTLVELIIVITILAILATIAFVSFQSYTKDARDANRTATIKNIEKGLELFTIKTGNFPTPDEPTTFTGGLDGKVKISQGIVWDGVATIINMNTTPLDPNDKSKYTYSTFWDDNKYYQVAINAENNQTSFIPETYAFTPKSAIVKWNYRFDPSLPSLIVVPSSVNTASWIFDPKVCFVIDWWQNSLSSSSWSCIEKQEMSLKEFDNSLIGYWDMETTSWTLLKDFSGNENSLICQNRDATTSTNINCVDKIINQWILWKSMQFNYNTITNIARTNSNIILNGTGYIDYSNWFTMSYLTKENITTFSQTPLYHYNYWFHRNPLTWLSSIRSYTFSWELLISWETSCRPAHPICINNMSFLKNNWYIWTNFNLNTIVFNDKSFLYYINGVRFYEFPIEIILGNIINQSTFFVWWSTSNASWYTWIIDDVKIYNRALTDEEIKQQAKIAGF